VEAQSAAKEHTSEARGGDRGPGVRGPGADLGQVVAEPFQKRRCFNNTPEFTRILSTGVQNDHAARCSRTPRQLQLRALDLLSSPC